MRPTPALASLCAFACAIALAVPAAAQGIKHRTPGQAPLEADPFREFEEYPDTGDLPRRPRGPAATRDFIINDYTFERWCSEIAGYGPERCAARQAEDLSAYRRDLDALMLEANRWVQQEFEAAEWRERLHRFDTLDPDFDRRQDISPYSERFDEPTRGGWN